MIYLYRISGLDDVTQCKFLFHADCKFCFKPTASYPWLKSLFSNTLEQKEWQCPFRMVHDYLKFGFIFYYSII